MKRALRWIGGLVVACAASACSDPNNYRPNSPLDAGRFNVACEGEFDQEPKLVAGKSPVFPIRMLNPDVIEDRKIRHLPLEWWVTTTFTVGVDGRTSVVKATPTSPQSFSDHMAIAVKSWRFTPASRSGTPTVARCSTRFGYSL